MHEDLILEVNLRRVSQINSGGVGFQRSGDLSNSGLVVQFWMCALFSVSQNLNLNH